MKKIETRGSRISRQSGFLYFLTFVCVFVLLGCSDNAKKAGEKNNSLVSQMGNDLLVENKTGEKNDSASFRNAPLFDIRSRQDRAPLDKKDKYIAWRISSTKEEELFVGLRWDRVSEAIKRKDIGNERVLEAFLRTPREFFCRPFNKKRAYDDAAIPIGYGQTISGPHMVSKMTNELNPDVDMKVLEIGTGSGYQAAVFAQLSNFVYSIEIIEPLAKETDDIYKGLETSYPELKNVKRKIADGYYGWPEYAPFDRIAVTCGIDHIPPALIEQLAPNGIMLIPVGPPNGQTLLKVTKKFSPTGEMTIEREDVYKGRYFPVFVPFTSEGGKGKHSIDKDKPSK